jgi:hypothetical protein
MRDDFQDRTKKVLADRDGPTVTGYVATSGRETMKRALILIVLLLAAWPCSAKDKTTFPTDDEIQRLLTQSDRAMQQYEPLIDEEERQLGKAGAEAVLKDRQVIKAVEIAVTALKKQSQGFNSPLGFALFEWLDDASRNALLCSQTAMTQANTGAMTGKIDDALRCMDLSQSCLGASTLIYTVSENAGALYERYVKAEEELANEGARAAQKCTETLKKLTAEKKQK